MIKSPIFLAAFILFSLLVPTNILGQIDDVWLIEDMLIEEIKEKKQGIVLKDLELHWSANTYVPPTYQGRKLTTRGSLVNVEAALKISGENPKNLKYSWFLDDVFQNNKSGYGKDKFQFRARRSGGASQTILVKTFNENRSFYTEKSIKIPIVEPELIIYASNGNSHFSDQASKVSMILAGKKFSFIAKPFFFGVKELAGLSFEWRFPGQNPIISSYYDANVLDLTISGKEDKEISKNELRINVSNKIDSRQKISQTIRLEIY